MIYFLYKCHTWRKFHKQQTQCSNLNGDISQFKFSRLLEVLYVKSKKKNKCRFVFLRCRNVSHRCRSVLVPKCLEFVWRGVWEPSREGWEKTVTGQNAPTFYQKRLPVARYTSSGYKRDRMIMNELTSPSLNSSHLISIYMYWHIFECLLRGPHFMSFFFLQVLLIYLEFN